MFDMPDQAARMILRGANGNDQDLLRFVARGQAAYPRSAIQSSPPNPRLPREIKLAESKKIDLVIARQGASWTLNGVASKGYAGEPLFRVKRGAPVTIGFDNGSRGSPIVMHVHGHAVRLLHDPTTVEDAYWRNAVVVPPGRVKHIAFLADSAGEWALHRRYSGTLRRRGSQLGSK